MRGLLSLRGGALRGPAAFVAALVVLLGAVAGPAVAGSNEGVSRFAILPATAPGPTPGSTRAAPGRPEGMTVDDKGNVYAASFELTEFGLSRAPRLRESALFRQRRGTGGEEGVQSGEPIEFSFNYIYVFNPRGEGIVSVALPPGVVPLGMTVRDNQLFVNDVINGDVLRYSLPLRFESEPNRVYDICGGYIVAFGAPGTFCALNDIAKFPDTSLIMSDNGDSSIGQLNGRIYRLFPDSGDSSVFFQSQEIRPEPGLFPTFGVNGIAVTPDQTGLIMANMSTDRIYRLGLNRGNTSSPPGRSNPITPGNLSLFAQTSEIDGPDDMTFDDRDRLWVVSGQNNQVVALDLNGRVVDTRGSYQGIDSIGAPIGLAQPSSIEYFDGRLIVSNEANQGLVPPNSPIDFSRLRRFTLAQIDIGRRDVDVQRGGDDDDEDPKKLTEEQKQQKQRTNTSNKDEYYTEGNVVAVSCGSDPQSVTIANRDGDVIVMLAKDARRICPSVKVGDYGEFDGYKEHEQLFYADEATISRR